MAAIEIPHVLNRRHEVTPIIVIIILKLRDLQVPLTLGHRRDYVVQLLELWLAQLRKTIDLLIVVLLELLIAEDHLVLQEVEHEPVVGLLVAAVFLDVLREVSIVRSGWWG